MMTESRLTLIHRVIVPDKEYPKEYAILVTDRRLVFIRQEKTRNGFALRGEVRFGTALVTDVAPKTPGDYEQTSLESLTADSMNINVPFETLISLEMKSDKVKFHWYEFFVRLTMKRQGGIFQVYNFELKYLDGRGHETTTKFYMVPLGMYFKPRRMTTTRETILREYAMEGLEIFRKVLSAKTILADLRADAQRMIGFLK
jgi:hypothetical protein